MKINLSRKLWVTHDLRYKQKLRDKSYLRAIRSNSSRLYEQHRHLRNQVTTEVKAAESSNFRAKLQSSKDTQTLWREIRKTGIIEPKNPSPLTLFPSNILNTYFACISRFDSQTIDKILTSPFDPMQPTFDFAKIDF